MDNIFYVPKDKKELAAKKKEQFMSIYGDHLTLLNILKQYRYSSMLLLLISREVHEDNDWCKENYINIKSIKMVMNIRKQLLLYLKKMNIAITVFRSSW